MEKITSKSNSTIKDFVKLKGSRSHRESSNLFVIEGVKLILEASNNGIEIEMVFVTASCFEKRSQELEKLFQTTCTVQISDEICEKMTDQKSPQGIFATCKIPQNLLTFQDIELGGRYVMLCDLQDTGNVGTIIRCAEALGFNGVIVSKETCDLLNPKVIRATMGSIFRMKTMMISDCVDFVERLNHDNIQTIASVVDDGACDIMKIEQSESMVLLIGNEGNGLCDKIANACSTRATIKMRGNSESLNAAMAACILMWEISKK